MVEAVLTRQVSFRVNARQAILGTTAKRIMEVKKKNKIKNYRKLMIIFLNFRMFD